MKDKFSQFAHLSVGLYNNKIKLHSYWRQMSDDSSSDGRRFLILRHLRYRRCLLCTNPVSATTGLCCVHCEWMLKMYVKSGTRFSNSLETTYRNQVGNLTALKVHKPMTHYTDTLCNKSLQIMMDVVSFSVIESSRPRK